MADKSAIEWTDATWNPIRARNKKTGKVGWHCEHATTGCEFCYAEGFNKRLGTGLAFKPGHRKDIEIFLDEAMLTQPLRWKKPRKIFPFSMTDLFADFVQVEWLDKIFAVMALTPHHDYQVVTKRAKRMRDYFNVAPAEAMHTRWLLAARSAFDAPAGAVINGEWPLPNVWLGVSAERQEEADERIPLLLQTPAAIRFISAEPLLGPIHFAPAWLPRLGHRLNPSPLHWVIDGGESGPSARPSNPQWYRHIRNQCEAASVPYFHKQNGEWVSVSEVEGAGQHFSFDDGRTVRRVGKKVAGRLLDGVEHNGFPTRENFSGI